VVTPPPTARLHAGTDRGAAWRRWWRAVDHWLSERPLWQIAVGSTVLLAAVGGGDYISGQQFLVGLTYFIPIGLATWYGGRRLGVPLAVVAAVVWTFSRAAVADWSFLGGALYVNALLQLPAYLFVLLVLDALHRSLRREAELALHDPLTGLANRRAFTEVAAHALAGARRADTPLALAYVDLDHFKEVNDTFGHERGDRLLVDVAEALRQATRASDLVTRFGGDEYCILLPDTDAAAARVVAGKVSAAVTPICRAALADGGISIGVAAFAHPPESIEAVLVAADRALYRIKDGSRGDIFIESVDARGQTIQEVVHR
jgi:diguanylate cyclase (GGDEF)-like protein